MKYLVAIMEILQKEISVEADNIENAEKIARDVYYNGDEVLYSDDYKETRFEVIKEKRNE